MPSQHTPDEARPALISMSAPTLSGIPFRFSHRRTRLQTCELALRTSQLADLINLASSFTSCVLPAALLAVDILLKDCIIGIEKINDPRPHCWSQLCVWVGDWWRQ